MEAAIVLSRLSFFCDRKRKDFSGRAGSATGVASSTNVHGFARSLFIFVRFVSIRGQSIGASREHETARCAVHENPRNAGHESARVGRRDTKTLRASLESQLAVAKDAGLRISRINADSSWVIEALERRKKNSALNSHFVGDKLEVFGCGGGGSWRWSMEVNIPLSTLPLQLEQAFVGCPFVFCP